MPPVRHLPLISVLLLASLGCHLRSGVVRPGGMTFRDEVDPLVGLANYTDEDLLRLAEEAFELRLYGRAYQLFSRYLDEFPDTVQHRSVTFNAGLAAEKADLPDEAIMLFRQLLDDHPGAEERVTLRFRLVECTVVAEHWIEAQDHIDWLLRRTDLGPTDRYELQVRRAWVDAATGRRARAEAELRRLTGLYRFDKGETYGAYHGAMAYYHLGEVYRLQAEAVLIVSVDDLDKAREELNEKAGHILDAQDAYLEAIRIGHHDWIPRAGWRLGGLYERFRIDLLGAPDPAEVRTEEDQQIYREILSEQTAILLLKARTVYQKVLDKAAEVSIYDEWVVHIREALFQLEAELLEGELAVDI